MQAERSWNSSPLSGRGSQITEPPRNGLPSLDSHLKEETPLPSDTSGSTLYAPSNENSGLHTESFEPLASINKHMPTREETSKRRCLPEPVETLSSSSRRDKSEPGSSFHPDSSTTTGSRPRKFTPQLLETARRSVRKDAPLGHCHNSQIPDITNDPAQEHVPESCPSDLPGACDQTKRRKHLIRIPDPPTVPSSYSGDSCFSELPSLSPSASSSELEKQPRIEDYRRESCDERFSQYLLSLAARSAEDQLKDRTLATFPNEQVHQPINHFAINTEDDPRLSEGNSSSYTKKEVSGADLSWELEYAHQHEGDADVRNQAMLSSPMPAMAAHQILETATQLQTGINGNEQGIDDPMVRPTSPPLLGDDLIFPQSLSPQGTRHIWGNSNCQRQDYFDQMYQPPGGLWCANLSVVQNGGGGLWMGTCHKPGESNGKSLFQGPISSTGTNHPGDVSMCPSEEFACEDTDQLSYSPSVASQTASDRKRRLTSQDDLEELDNGFVTQIYNYLSLGYPCVAHDYDEELSDVSNIPVGELRRDNFHTDDKGYVGIIEGTAGSTGYAGYTCMRWVALRLYIQEWANRQPRLPGVEASGVCERRGSWAG